MATKNTKIATKQQNTNDDVSTREMILARSLELINTKGMVDFRIDSLATSLGLSPGNITYHFSRKEDICVALWERYLEEYKLVTRSLTTLLDIKQLYIISRINIRLNYKYRGVVAFRSSDLGAMTRDIENGRVNEEEHHEKTKLIFQLLDRNGYLEKGLSDDLILGSYTFHFLMTRWMNNFAFQAYEPDEIEEKLDYLALLSLYSHYSVFTQKGRDEFEMIMDKVNAGDLLGESMVV